MKRLVLLLVALPLSAQAQTYQTYRQNLGNGFWNSQTYGNGQSYQTFGSPNNSMTFGPNGYSSQTFYGSNGSSMTFVNPGLNDDE